MYTEVDSSKVASRDESFALPVSFPCSAGVDYVAVNVTVAFLPGQITQEVRVSLAEDDIFPEPNKTFEVYLAASPGVYLSPITYTVVTILNDDPDLPGMCMTEASVLFVYVCVCAPHGKFVCQSLLTRYTYSVVWTSCAVVPESSDVHSCSIEDRAVFGVFLLLQL